MFERRVHCVRGAWTFALTKSRDNNMFELIQINKIEQ